MSKTSEARRPWIKVLLTVGACLVLLGGAGLGYWLIHQSEPEAERSGATRRNAALVETVTITRGTYRPTLTVLGRIQPARAVTLTPRVTGEVLDVADKLMPGGRVRKNEILLQIDPAEFEAQEAMRLSTLQEAQAQLKLEQGQQRVAEQDFAFLEGEVDKSQRALALREPQLETAKARVAAAQADLRMARIDLRAATVRAPFDATVLTRQVDVGSRVSPGQPLAQLVGLEAYWMYASVPIANLRWLTFADGDGQGDVSAVKLRSSGRWGATQAKSGRLESLIGDVDNQTRLAHVLISIPDPLGIKDGSPLILGTIIEATIVGREVEDVIRLDRRSLRAGDTVWVMNGGQLEIRQVEVIFSDEQQVFLRGDLQPGDEVVTTDLASPRPGTPLRKMSSGTLSPSTQRAATTQAGRP